MKFNFYPNESRIYDFLKFPRLVFYIEAHEEMEDEHNYKDIDIDDYLDFVREVEIKLKPYEKEIKKFYTKKFTDSYSFVESIMKANSIFSYKDEKEYLNMLLSMSDEDIIRSIVYSITMFNQDFGGSLRESVKRAEEISSKEENIKRENVIELIKEFPIDPSEKWNLFLMAENPTRYMKEYVKLMNNIFSIFEEFYLDYEKEVNRYGKYLVDFLNKKGDSGLEEITYSILDLNMLEGEEVKILISLMFSYELAVTSQEEDMYFAWGLKMEKAFKEMKAINENKVNERVQIFKNLGDRTRYEVLKLIASGETSTKNIAKVLDVSSATISYHINNLLTSKVIKINTSKDKYRYRVDYDLLEKVIEGFKEDLNLKKEQK